MDPWKSVVPVYVCVSLSFNLFEKLLVHVSSMTTKRSGKSCVCIMCLLEGFSVCRMIGWLLFKTDVSHNCADCELHLLLVLMLFSFQISDLQSTS